MSSARSACKQEERDRDRPHVAGRRGIARTLRIGLVTPRTGRASVEELG
jgi:hypothetical protein